MITDGPSARAMAVPRPPSRAGEDTHSRQLVGCPSSPAGSPDFQPRIRWRGFKRSAQILNAVVCRSSTSRLGVPDVPSPAFLLGTFVHAVDEMGEPSDVILGQYDPEIRKPFEHSLEDEGRKGVLDLVARRRADHTVVDRQCSSRIGRFKPPVARPSKPSWPEQATPIDLNLRAAGAGRSGLGAAVGVVGRGRIALTPLGKRNSFAGVE